MDRHTARRVHHAHVGGDEPAVRHGLPGQVGPQAVPGEQDGAGDLDPARRAGADRNAGERHPVIRAPAAGLGHAVGGDHPGTGRAGGVKQPGRRGRPAEQDGGEPGQVGPGGQQPAQLGRDERGVGAAEPGQVRLAPQRPRHHQGGAADQGTRQDPEPGDMAGRQGAQPALTGPGADPVQAGPGRVQQRAGG